jgi:hypothetical protein
MREGGPNTLFLGGWQTLPLHVKSLECVGPVCVLFFIGLSCRQYPSILTPPVQFRVSIAFTQSQASEELCFRIKMQHG